MSQMELFESPPPTPAAEPAFMVPADLFELSVDAFYAAVCANMSELPIRQEISRFIEKVGAAGNREEAARIACDRGDPDARAVLRAAGKVQTEIHRLTGFLRFSPDARGAYVATCEPDYFILPALAEH
ncbi:MAG: DUF4130 domain-containing protein, partial [Treponema sp.]|nr:DUF4130 domain-containing protein [Treponema sp.]